MESSNTLPRPWKAKAIALIIASILLISFITNPGEKGFRRYLKEYVRTESGSTLADTDVETPVSFTRNNYYLYSLYSVNIDGIEHHYMGMFGSFHNYY